MSEALACRQDEGHRTEDPYPLTVSPSETRTPAELETPCTLSPIAASAAASEPSDTAVARLDAALGSPVVTVDVVTFSGALCSSCRLEAGMPAASG